MAIYVVTYDLNNETNRPPITKEFDATAYARLSESCYAIETDEGPEDVFARFKKHLDADDHLYVVTLSAPWTGYGPKEVIDWMTAALGS